MKFNQKLNTHIILKRLAKALIGLRVCAGWSEPFAGGTYHVVGNLMSQLKCYGNRTTQNSTKESLVRHLVLCDRRHEKISKHLELPDANIMTSFNTHVSGL